MLDAKCVNFTRVSIFKDLRRLRLQNIVVLSNESFAEIKLSDDDFASSPEQIYGSLETYS